MKRALRYFVRPAAVVLCGILLLLSFEVALVPTPSMEHTVLVGDNVLVFKLFDAPRLPFSSFRLPRLRAPHRGSLVSFVSPSNPHMVYLKRVAAVAGDTIEFRDGFLCVNGAQVAESYAARSTRVPNISPHRLHPGELFVVGDNRDLSEDSRDFGPVSTGSVVGMPLAVVWSARGRTSDLLDTHGNVRLAFYWSALLHPVASTRWSRLGKLL